MEIIKNMSVSRVNLFDFTGSILVLLLAHTVVCIDDECPYRQQWSSIVALLRPDNRFAIEIEGIGDKYIPNALYKVWLNSTDGVSTFVAFTISAREDTKFNEKNPSRPLPLNPGTVSITNDSNTMSTPECPNIVYQKDYTPKTSVLAQWRAPPNENKCVTIYAVVAVIQNVWYRNDGPLSKKVCEDRRKAFDMPPKENNDCLACEDARYLLTFQGMWSSNTHLHKLYPEHIARFSDVVGASHSKNFNVYRENLEARPGLKMLAEQGNTTQLEIEIQAQLGTSVRTIIKATAQPISNMTTSVLFRTSPRHHVVSLVAAILPSPDWFVGVSGMELCDYDTNQWLKNVTLNLYPMDAGTDSGTTFESPNEATSPPRPVSSAHITDEVKREDIKPFARLKFDLIRTYFIPNCSNARQDQEKVIPPEVTTPIPGGSDTEDPAGCTFTEWGDWLTCEGDCIDDKVNGYHTRIRSISPKNVQEDCAEGLTETEECEENCL